jgi:hypothetical protein
MVDPLTTPLLVLVLGKLADEIIGGACRDYLKGKLKSLFTKAAKLGSKDDLQLAFEGAMQCSRPPPTTARPRSNRCSTIHCGRSSPPET